MLFGERLVDGLDICENSKLDREVTQLKDLLNVDTQYTTLNNIYMY